MIIEQIIGTTISHFHILELLGMGGMGTVYKALDTRLDTLRALKFLHPSGTYANTARSGLSREARTQGQLLHPNIATLMSLESSDFGDFLVMEYVDGPSLDLFLSRTNPSLEVRLQLILEVAAALATAHAQGIIHRDIKPTNVLVAPDGSAKVTDFGLARLIEQTTVSTTNSMGGTAPYMPPEAFRGESYTKAGDIWALGVLAYEMMEGKRPFGGGTFEALGYQILNSTPDPISPRTVQSVPRLDDWISTCLEKNPRVRFPDGASGLTQLAAIIQHAGLTPEVSIPSLPRRISPLRKRKVLTRIAAGGLLLLTGIMILFPSGRSGSLGFDENAWEENEGNGIRSPVWDGEGIRLAYITGEESSVLQIVDTLAPSRAADTCSLNTESLISDLGWRPGSQILGVRDRDGGLYLFDVTDQKLIPLQITSANAFSWSEDGSFIAYSRRDSLRNCLEIVGPVPTDMESLVLPLPSRRLTIGPLGQTGPPPVCKSPVFMHDDRLIAFALFNGPTNLGVYCLAIDTLPGEKPQLLIPKDYRPHEFSWNGDKKRLLFTPLWSDTLYSMEVSNKGTLVNDIVPELNLAGLDEWDYHPTSGRLLALLSTVTRLIWQTSVTGGDSFTVLIEDESQLSSPAYSTAQLKLYFCRISPLEGKRLFYHDLSTGRSVPVMGPDIRFTEVWCPIPDPISEQFLVFRAEALGTRGLFYRNLQNGVTDVLHPNITDEYRIWHPFWTRDGRSIYYVLRNNTGSEPDRVFRIDLERQGNELHSSDAEEIFTYETIHFPIAEESGRFLLFQRESGATDSLLIYDQSLDVLRYVTSGSFPTLDPTGGVLYFTFQSSIYRIEEWTSYDPTHQDPLQVIQLPDQMLRLGPGGGHALAIGGDTLFIAISTAGPDLLIWSQPPY